MRTVACELLHEKYRKYLDRGIRVGKDIKDEWNSGSDRPMLWQMYCTLVGSVLTTLNANKVSGKFPYMTYWTFNMLMEHRSDIVSHRLQQGRRCQTEQVDYWFC